MLVVFAAVVSCGDAAADDPFAPVPCTPGEQRECACPGGSPPGVQVCEPAGDRFGACTGCLEAATTTTDPAATTTGSTGVVDPTGVDSSEGEATTGIPGDGIPDHPPQSVPPAPPPDGEAIVEQVAAEHPEWLTGSCVEQGGNNDFLVEVVRRLRAEDDRWGLNWKRGVVGDLSQDAIDYHWGEGTSEGSTEVFIIDVIVGHCPKDATPPQAAWIDVTQATADAGTIGMWTLADQDL